MHFFWKLYQFSLGRMSRSREFRADGIGASHGSPEALARALVKIGACCEYRGKTENDIIAKREMEAELQLADLLAALGKYYGRHQTAAQHRAQGLESS